MLVNDFVSSCSDLSGSQPLIGLMLLTCLQVFIILSNLQRGILRHRLKYLAQGHTDCNSLRQTAASASSVHAPQNVLKLLYEDSGFAGFQTLSLCMFTSSALWERPLQRELYLSKDIPCYFLAGALCCHWGPVYQETSRAVHWKPLLFRGLLYLASLSIFRLKNSYSRINTDSTKLCITQGVSHSIMQALIIDESRSLQAVLECSKLGLHVYLRVERPLLYSVQPTHQSFHLNLNWAL